MKFLRSLVQIQSEAFFFILVSDDFGQTIVRLLFLSKKQKQNRNKNRKISSKRQKPKRIEKIGKSGQKDKTIWSKRQK